jgi:DNA modification methylase
MIETINIASLISDPTNSRKHPKKNLEAIKGSLVRFGQQKPLVVGEDNVVIAGNGTLEAAKELGWDTIQIIRSDLKGTDRTAFAIADNRTGELAAWDDEVLRASLEALRADDFDVSAIGFDDKDMARIVKEMESDLNEDRNNLPQDFDTRCKLGDLWTLGRHRLICGDSNDPNQLARMIGTEKVDLLFTDPPYGIDLNTSYQREDRTEGNIYEKVQGDDEPFDPGFLLTYFQKAKEVFIWGADNFCNKLPLGGSWIVWDKSNEAMDKIDFSGDFELCWSKNRHKYAMYRKLWSGFTAKEKGETRIHPTQKPIEMALWFLEKWGKKAQTIADPFLGSGSTLIACEQLGKSCFGMEINPKYCDLILKRWENLSGKTAILQP